MPLDSVTDFVAAVSAHGLLPPEQARELAHSLRARFEDPRALARELLGRDWLTPYQVNQLFRGNGAGLVLGPYVLLERLGEGGKGEVFTARHQKLRRVVALKVLHRDRLKDADAVRRFRREIEAVAQLDHPNVVHAHDADQAGDVHFLVMEYVEGTDLGKFVKKNGPLPADVACDYVRQAALGLHHAFEHGLVHRDVKPANLLLANVAGPRPGGVGVIKLLDLGLARLREASSEEEGASTLTHQGSVMGTPDYLSPEQALNSHAVDIRADVYSLGCTLYFLLTGRPPFPGGSVMEKLLRHRFNEPEPILRLRPDVPPAVEEAIAVRATRAETARLVRVPPNPGARVRLRLPPAATLPALAPPELVRV